jgi:hypothetical protein
MTTLGAAGPSVNESKCAAYQVSGGAGADRKIDHLCRENERSQHAQKSRAAFVKLALSAARNVCYRGRRGHVHGGPHRSRKESVWMCKLPLTVAQIGKFVPRRGRAPVRNSRNDTM